MPKASLHLATAPERSSSAPTQLFDRQDAAKASAWTITTTLTGSCSTDRKKSVANQKDKAFQKMTGVSQPQNGGSPWYVVVTWLSTGSATLLVIAVLFLSANGFAAEAWREPADFRGLKWGASPSEAKRYFPRLDPYWFEDGPVQQYFAKGEQVSDTLIVHFLLFFFEKSFFAVNMEFRTEQFDQVASIFQARYGKPHSTRKDILQNAFGASFPNVTHSWSGPTVMIELLKHDSVTDGRASIGKKDLLQKFEMSKRQRAKDAAKGF